MTVFIVMTFLAITSSPWTITQMRGLNSSTPVGDPVLTEIIKTMIDDFFLLTSFDLWTQEVRAGFVFLPLVCPCLKVLCPLPSAGLCCAIPIRR